MKYKILIVFVLTAVLTFSIINFAQAAPTPPPQNTGTGQPTPPSPNTGTGHPTPPPPNVGNETQPFKERLEAFYIAKENYINQKRMCKESAAATNAPSGTCWNKLKPLMQRILLNEVDLTEKRLIQLQEQNITFPNRNDIDAKLAESKAVFADSSSSKYAMKSAAKNVEDLVNQIEEVATQNQPEILIRQMDNLMVKADSITTKLDAKLIELKASGYNTAELENSLADYKADLAKTKEEIANAKARYAQTNNTQDISQMAKEVRNFINNAQNYLVKAFDKARAMVPEMSDAEKGGKGKSSKEGTV